MVTYKEILSVSLFTVVLYFIFKKSKEDIINDEATTKKINDAFNPDKYKEIYINSKYAKNNKKVNEYINEKGFDTKKLASIVTNLYNTKGIINDDEDALYSIFRMLPNIFFISLISYAFNDYYKQDLRLFLTSFLNEKELNEIYKIINRKDYI